MKKSLILGVLGLVAVAASSYGQGYILLDNYISNGGAGGPVITYGFDVPANGVSGALGTPGTGLLGGWTAGIYFVAGTPSITDPAGMGFPDAQLAVGTGPGSTAAFWTSTFGTPGEFMAANPFLVGGTGGVTPTITAEIVFYPTSAGSYAAAMFRAHSAPFTMPSNGAIIPSHPLVGDYFSAFSMILIPEPTTLALGALGGLSLLLFRRRK
jgi:hypothetical protein